ncbi:hypothetical protein IMSAGC020_02053 [Lachnospiraceae bacterium]|nr:hypothetical protein IMSAGC020_02053 [Lachnospiraceae bacterium]
MLYNSNVVIVRQDVFGYKMGTAALKPHKREIKTYQNDAILKRKAMKNTICRELEKEFE